MLFYTYTTFSFCELYTVCCGLDIGGFETEIEYLIIAPIYSRSFRKGDQACDYGGDVGGVKPPRNNFVMSKI